MKRPERPATDPLRAMITEALAPGSEREPAGAGPHPQIDQLVRYHAGELTEAHEARVRDHLVTCRECTETLLDLDRFVVAGADQKAAATAPAPAGLGRRPLLTMAASLLIAATALGTLGIWLAREHRAAERLRQRVAALSAPRPDVPIVDLLPDSSVRGEAGREPATLPPGEEYVTLVLNLPQAAEVHAFEAEIVDPRGTVVWEGPIQRSRFGTFTLGVWRRSLPPGENVIRLYGLGGGGTDGRSLLETYVLRVEPNRSAGEER